MDGPGLGNVGRHETMHTVDRFSEVPPAQTPTSLGGLARYDKKTTKVKRPSCWSALCVCGTRRYRQHWRDMHCSYALILLFGTSAAETIVPLKSGGSLALSTRGSSAFRVRFNVDADYTPVDTPMVQPNALDAPFSSVVVGQGIGIKAAFGSVILSPDSELVLLDAAGKELTRSKPLGSVPQNDTCMSQSGTDITGGTHAAPPLTVDDEAACCAACKAHSGCKYWISGSGDPAGNCWLMATISGTRMSPNRILGGDGGGNALVLSSKSGGKLYGSGASKNDHPTLTRASGNAYVGNTMVFAPHFYSEADGFACLAVVNTTTGNGKTNVFPVAYSTSDVAVSWSHPPNQPFELYLMPAASLDLGTAAYYALIGMPAVPPRYAFGFIASRWGWQNRSYIESVLHEFRAGHYPIDAFIGDFGWFTNVSDYAFSPQGESYYEDFGYNNATFPEPKVQLKQYKQNLHIRMGGIRKPRLGGTSMISEARAKGYLLPGGELSGDGQVGYAERRNINYSIPAARAWYAEHQKHYYDEGVSFFWNDEGETDYFTFHWWNVAQADSLRQIDPTQRFYSINRAWSPGMARLGATVWTGDINPSWSDLASTPAMLLNWALAGAPYVACDIGGFTGQTTSQLLTRWMQLGVFLPTMRVHSTLSAVPHFPWLWGEPYASLMRRALELRYQLLPYHYSLAHQMAATGKLWMRPLASEFAADSTAAAVATQWLDGALLIAPIISEASKRNVYLPAGKWFHFNTSALERGPTTLSGTADMSEIPVFVPPGAIVPLAPVVQSTSALPGGPLEVQAYAGADGTFELVEDDGETYKHLSGAVRKTAFKWHDTTRTLSWVVTGGSVAQMFTHLSLTVFGDGKIAKSAVVAIGTKGHVTA